MTNLEKIAEQFKEAHYVLQSFISNKNSFTAIESAANIMVESLNKGRKIMSCGNGGSMADAIHFAEELTGKFRDNRKPIAAISISDSGYISCVSNDYGYQYVFSRFIEAVGNEADVLLAISTSGNSENIVKAVEKAKEKHIKTIALTGNDGGKLSKLVDVEIRVPHIGYADRIQEVHIKIIHTLIYLIESKTL